MHQAAAALHTGGEVTKTTGEWRQSALFTHHPRPTLAIKTGLVQTFERQRADVRLG